MANKSRHNEPAAAPEDVERMEEEGGATETVDPAPGLADEIVELRKERDSLQDRLLRQAAEFDNYRKRIDRERKDVQASKIPDANWLLADACEITALHEAGLAECDVVVAATGDDKVNLVVSLLAKTEFGVPRTVARVNNPKNEWMFDEAWGVDVNVSTPRIMSALVEEAVTVGDLVRLFTFRQGNANLVEMTLPDGSPYVGKPSGLIPFPENVALVTILRDGQVYTPDPEQPVEAGDELLFVCQADVEEELEQLLAPRATD
jgi:trk system potassium uptake protein TrkA